MRTALPPAGLLRGRQGSRLVLTRDTRVLSLDVFGLALQQTLFEPTDLHRLVGSVLWRRFPKLGAGYVALRQEAEESARRQAESSGAREISPPDITDHLATLLDGGELGAAAPEVARAAVRVELDLRQVISRSDPRALYLHDEALERGIVTAFVADSHLPRDLVSRILDATHFRFDHLLVSSNEAARKDSGLFQRLVDITGARPSEIVHLGPDRRLDVECPRRLGIRGYLTTTGRPQISEATFQLGLTQRSGVDSIGLALARDRLGLGGADESTATDIGYYAGGPLAAGFGSWVGRLIDDQVPRQVIFCGPTGDLVRRVLSILRPDLPSRLLTTFPCADPGQCRLAHLDNLERVIGVRDEQRLLVVETGWEGESHRLVQGWADAAGRAIDVTGAYLGLREPTARRDAQTWAFHGAPSCPMHAIVAKRPEVLQALLRSVPDGGRRFGSELDTYRSTAEQVAAGVLAYAEDFQPWIRIDYRRTTPAMAEPALRVIADPTHAEAQALGRYPVIDPDGRRPAVPLAQLPPRSLLSRNPGLVESRADDALWAEGYRALAEGSARSRSKRRVRRILGRRVRSGQRR